MRRGHCRSRGQTGLLCPSPVWEEKAGIGPGNGWDWAMGCVLTLQLHSKHGAKVWATLSPVLYCHDDHPCSSGWDLARSSPCTTEQCQPTPWGTGALSVPSTNGAATSRWNQDSLEWHHPGALTWLQRQGPLSVTWRPLPGAVLGAPTWGYSGHDCVL